MLNDWKTVQLGSDLCTTVNNPFKEIDLVDAVAEVIASKIAHQDYLHHIRYGPGEITGLEMNQEHIYVSTE